MITRQRPAGDLELVRLPNGRTDLRLIDGADAVAQRIASALRFWLGEWYLDERQGFPWRERVFVANPDLSEIRALFASAIAQDPAVEAVEALELVADVQGRALAVTFSARLVSGDVLAVQAPSDSRFVFGVPVRPEIG